MNGFNRCCGKKHGQNVQKMYAMPVEVKEEVAFMPEMQPMPCGHPMPEMQPMPCGHPMPEMQPMPCGHPMPGMQPMPEMQPFQGMHMGQAPMMQAPMGHANHVAHGVETVTQVVEPTVYCTPNEFHHYNKVEHIVPVAVKNIHHYHTQHEYIFCKESEQNEACQYDYGLECGKDLCELACNTHQGPRW